ncbi:unnamed protein product [Rangifer tarandus platyrhynchus]|uniref:Uncharacterized protein n=1 Tax=Rangifer tarandus platyrhynchus TaxID=3082113 RepID=A0ABN8Z6G9_RANTA|nr:unnamed protein product [Rangifer tarandus platyrhynchus]CAI9687950.1 unnamed protein product [Rangifer tarandus platyrhynchus]
MPASPESPVTPQTGRPRAETHDRATTAGAEERLAAPIRSGPGRPGGGVPPPRPRRGVPPPPPGRAPPGPRHLEEPRFRSRGGDRGVRNRSSPFPLRLAAPRPPLSTSGAGPPPPVPAHLSRLKLWAFAGLAESSHRDLAPPGPGSLRSHGPRPLPGTPPPAPSRPIRRRVPSHALVRPRSSARTPAPPRLRRPKATARLAPADCPLALRFLGMPPFSALFPARPTPVAALDSHVPEHTALLSRLSALCFKCLISQDRIAAELWEGRPVCLSPVSRHSLYPLYVLRGVLR